jgi:ribosomal protein S18 acetylase RimI-like enzyme
MASAAATAPEATPAPSRSGSDSAVDIRNIKAVEIEAAGALLYRAFENAAGDHGFPAPWGSEMQACGLLERHRDAADRVLVAEEGGAVVGVGAVRLRGEVATIGPLATYIPGRGIGGALLDELLRRADEGGTLAQRLYVDAWNPGAYALYAGRGFGVIDTVVHVERAPAPGPALESARGLEVRAFEARDADDVARLDRKLTGHDRPEDLTERVRLVARRRGDVVGYLGASEAGSAVLLGPAVAVDASDLFTLITHALAGGDGSAWSAAGRPLRARLSTAAPAASMAALGLGFRFRELGVIMSRGAPPPARPPQLYSIDPEIV